MLPTSVSHRRFTRLHFALAPGLLTLLVAGCTSEPEAEPDRYTTRGIVRQLPVSTQPGSELFIHHEEVPEFRDMEGENTGMGAMMMPFPVADPALLQNIRVGDRVRFTFEVRWQGSPPIEVTEIEPLPPETRLSFETEPTEAENGGESEPSGGEHGQHGDHGDHGDHGSEPAPKGP